MTIFELQQLAAQGESSTLEFKKSTAQLHRAFETICGFLNGSGGTVFIGITDKGKIIGQEVSDSTQKDIAHEIARIDPPCYIDVQYIPIEAGSNLKVISLKVMSGNSGPYMYDGRAFQRVETTTVRMSQHLFKQMIIDRDRIENPWEKLFAHGYDVEDLDYEEIHRTVDFAIRANRLPVEARQDNIKDILKNLELMEGDKIFNGAVALFAKKINLSYGQCGLRMARFIGTDRIRGFIDQKQIEGNVFFLLDEAENFLKRHIPVAGTFQDDRFERINTPALPPLALREALINMLCHRNYGFSSPTSALAIYDDRVEIWNYGTLLKGLNFEDLKKPHHSMLRNRLIANVFYKRDFIEKWGSGTLKMLTLCKEQRLPEPEFLENTGGVEVVFRFKKSIGPVYLEDRDDLTVLLKGQKISQRQQEALKFSAEHDGITINLYQGLFPNIPKRTLQREIHNLLEKGLIEKFGSTHKLVYKIKKNNS